MKAFPQNAKAALPGGHTLQQQTAFSSSHSNKRDARKTNLWMPIWIGDHLADTMHLSCQQHGAYLLLLLAYWRNQGPLNNVPDELRRICRLTSRQFKKDWPRIAPFFEICNGTIVHSRSDREIAEWSSKKERFKQRSLKGSTERWRSKHDASSMAQALPAPCPSPSPSSEPSPRPANISLSNSGPQTSLRLGEREKGDWTGTIDWLAKEMSVPREDVEKARVVHAVAMSNLTSGAYPTPKNFAEALPSILQRLAKKRPHSPNPKRRQERVLDLRNKWWTQWRSEEGACKAESWEDGTDAERTNFMKSKWGDYFRVEAERPGAQIAVDEYGAIRANRNN